MKYLSFFLFCFFFFFCSADKLNWRKWGVHLIAIVPDPTSASKRRGTISDLGPVCDRECGAEVRYQTTGFGGAPTAVKGA
jgi:hypothetical protein